MAPCHDPKINRSWGTGHILQQSKNWAEYLVKKIKAILKDWKESYEKPRQCIKKQRYQFANKGPYSQSHGFSSSHVRCESWIIKKAEHGRINAFKLWCWRRFFESPLYCKEIKPVNLKGNQPWIFIGRTVAEAEAPILRPLDEKSQHIGKDYDAGKCWKQKEKGVAEDEMVI